MSTNLEIRILEHLKIHSSCSSKELHNIINDTVSYATTKRLLSKLVQEHVLITLGQGKSTKYSISPVIQLLQPIDVDVYFEKEIDDREIKSSFNLDLISDVLMRSSLVISFFENKLLRIRTS